MAASFARAGWVPKIGAVKPLAVLLASIGLATVAADASARPFRVDELPNGSKHTCFNCHDDDQGKTFNDFGSAARGALDKTGQIQDAHVHWDLLCPYDTDDDGWTNGEELGDPDCVWTVGATPAKTAAYLPGHPESHPPPICDNGKLDAGEDCEGTMMSETDCMAVEAGNGQLACTPDCLFDYSACSAPPGGSSGSGYDETGSDSGGGCIIATGDDGARGAAGMLVLVGAALALSRRARRER